jgi:hypothetical protein
MGRWCRLLRCHAAADLGEHVVGATANQTDRADHYHKDYRQHHRVFGDVLTTLLCPKSTDCVDHFIPQSTAHSGCKSIQETAPGRRMILKVS